MSVEKVIVEATIPKNITLISYGRRYGPPSGLDNKIDVRFLPNPSSASRKGRTGLDARLCKEVAVDAEDVVAKIIGMIETAETLNKSDSTTTIGVCCEHGKHRSVAVVSLVVKKYSGSSNIMVIHRDVMRKAKDDRKQRKSHKERY
jgi:RNase adapter protein RapZ